MRPLLVTALVVSVSASGGIPRAAAATKAVEIPQMPSVDDIKSVPYRTVKVKNDAETAFTAAKLTLPGAVKTTAKTTTTATSGVKVAGTPLTLTRTDAAATYGVEVASQAAAEAAGVHGVLFTLTGQDTAAASGSVKVAVNYSGFSQVEGGNFGARLELVQLPACALSTPDLPECREQTPLQSDNDTKNEAVAADVNLATTATTASSATGASSAASKVAKSAGAVAAAPKAVVAATTPPAPTGGGKSGSYTATSLEPSGSWTQGGSSGSFRYDYPITMPATRGTLSPSWGLHYDSASVDGKTSSTAAQSSWIGDGWGDDASYVEQSFVPCSESPRGKEAPEKIYDNCYAGDILTLVLNGKVTPLVRDKSTGVFRPQSDGGEVVTRVKGATGSGAEVEDYWQVTTRDGTSYQFGRNRLPGWSKDLPETKSVATVPVYSPQSGDPCYDKAKGFSGSVCQMAYRWNLDYVHDVQGAAVAYYYAQDTNLYGQRKGKTQARYVRDTFPDHIDYGFRDGQAYALKAPNRVVFKADDRCLAASCAPLSKTTAAKWPDVPFSNVCASGEKKCDTWVPTFFSTHRLTSITTKQYSPAAKDYVTVDSYALTQKLPETGDGGKISPTLWLDSIQHTGSDGTAGGPSTPITVPPVTFTGVRLQNRTDTAVHPERPGASVLPPFYRYRIGSVTTESGSVIQVSYEQENACKTPVTLEPEANTSSCYPVYWTPEGYYKPILDWFNTYVVRQVTQDDTTGGSDTIVTEYQYPGGAAWHHDDLETVQAKYRSYGQFRGYPTVETRTGAKTPGVKRTLTKTTYYRGMSKNAGGAAVNLTDSQGGVHEDLDELAGAALETTAHLGDGGDPDHSTITSYWVSAPTATRDRTETKLPDLTARTVAVAQEYTRQAVTSTANTTWRATATEHSYDDDPASPTFGLEQATYSHTVPAQAAYDRCTTTSYPPPNKGANLIGLPAQVETDAVACAGWKPPAKASAPTTLNTLTAPTTVKRPDQVVAATRTYYDDESFDTTFPQAKAPTRGEATMVSQAKGATNGVLDYQTTSRTVYDGTYGRTVKVFDANGNATTTEYTDNTAGIPIAITVTNAAGHRTATTLAPARGLPITQTDPNTVTTTTQYDTLGRKTAIWLASRATTTAPNYRFTYNLTNNGVTWVRSQTLRGSAEYIPSYTLLDSLLRTRETQAEGHGGDRKAGIGVGRVVEETTYDSHGWATEKRNPWWNTTATPNTSLVTTDLQNVPNAVVTAYDGLGRPAVVESLKRNAVQTRTTTVYNGDRTTVIPPTGGTTQTTVTDPAGRTVELDEYTSPPTLTTPADTFTGIWRVSGGTVTKTSYGYNARGDQNTVTDADGATWTTTYDLLGRPVTKDDPDAGHSTSSYDPNGNLLESTDSRGKTVSTTYDALNRKTARYTAATKDQAASNLQASWVYDNTNNAVTGLANPLGQLTTATTKLDGQPVTTQYLGFDNFGNSLGEDLTIPTTAAPELAGTYTYRHAFDADLGLLTTNLRPAVPGLGKQTLRYLYDIFNQPTTSGPASEIHYDALGRINALTLIAPAGNRLITYAYDNHTGNLTDQITSGQAGSDTAPTLNWESYGYDPAGNLTRQSETRNGDATTSETQCFTYDALRRLSSAWTATDECAKTPTATDHSTVGDNLGTVSAYWTSWTYTDTGLRRTQTEHNLAAGGKDTVTTHSYGHDNGAQPHTLASVTTTGVSTGKTAYSYDDAGNTTTRDTPDGAQTLQWDDTGKPTKITTGGKVSELRYDAEGNLLLQKDPDTLTLYLPSEQITLDLKTRTPSAVRYSSSPDGSTGYTATGGHRGVKINDAHGTALLDLDETKTTPTWRQSTPFGAPRGGNVAWLDNRTFLGKPTSPTTGLTTVGARQYDPATGTFLSVDPLLDPAAPQSLNGYGYAANNPTTFSDPTGLRVGDSGMNNPNLQAAQDYQRRVNQEVQRQQSPKPKSRQQVGYNRKGWAPCTNPDWKPPVREKTWLDTAVNIDRGMADGAYEYTVGAIGSLAGFAHVPWLPEKVDSWQESMDNWLGGDEHATETKLAYGATSVGAILIDGVGVAGAIVKGAPKVAPRLAGWLGRGERAATVANIAIKVRPPLSIPKGQFGAKWGKHAMDYGLDPSDAAARAGFMTRIRNVHLNPDEVRLGKFRDYDQAFMFRRGEDLLITRADGTFVSMYPGASASSWFKNAEVFPH